MQYIEIKLKRVFLDSESSNCYRMEFEDIDGLLRLPIIISSYDAQPLLSLLDGDVPMRPRTHEVFVNFVKETGYSLNSVIIHHFAKGIFHATSIFDNYDKSIELDCRPSDAVAIALRMDAKIFVAEDIAEKIGVLLNEEGAQVSVSQKIQTLEIRLKHLVGEERYEEAAKVRDKIEVLKNSMAR